MKKLPLILLPICIGLLLITPPILAAGTTELHIVKYANDGSTSLNETTVDYTWMMNNLEVYGDGVTHYYHQGPIFEDAWEAEHPNETWDQNEDKWNPEEDVNVLGKDLGAVKGTNVKDLCDLVGGMADGDTVEIKAVDGFFKKFPYENVYEPEPRQGPIVVTWYTKDATESGSESGYVSDGYSNGMRLVFFADTSTNPWGKHVFGITDMKICLPDEYWHYYQYPDYPTSTGYTVKYINRILIYSGIEPPELSSLAVSPTEITLEVGETQQFNATAYDQNGNEMSKVSFTWTSSDENVGTIDDTGLFEAITSGTATINATNGSVTGTATVTVVDGGGDADGGNGGSSGGSSAKITPTPRPTPTTTALPVTKASRSVPVLNAGEEVAMAFEDMGISLLTLKADTTVNEVTVIVERVEKTVDILEPFGLAYAYLDITLENARSTSIKGTVEFKVTKSWVIDNDINETTITLSQYNERDGWTSLATSNVGEDNTSVFFEAEIPHFSLFAIMGEKKEENQTPTSLPTPSPTAIPTQTPLATPEAPPTLHKGSPTPDADETRLPGFDVIFAACGLLVVGYTAKRGKK